MVRHNLLSAESGARVRLAAGLYVWHVKGRIYVHLYHSSEVEAKLWDGSSVRLRQETKYPWEGDVAMTVQTAEELWPVPQDSGMGRWRSSRGEWQSVS